MRFLILAIALVWLAIPASAKTGTDCAAIQDASKRLLCYDLVFQNAPTIPDIEQNKAWKIDEKTSRIDDTKIVTIWQISEDYFMGNYNRKKYVGLYFVCRENVTSMYFSFPKTVMSDIDGFGNVTLRIDKQKAFDDSFTASTDSFALGLATAATVIPFVKKLFKNSKLALRFTPFREGSSTVTFNIAGIENAIKPLAKACHWG